MGLNILDILLAGDGNSKNILCFLGRTTDYIHFSETCKNVEKCIFNPNNDVIWKYAAQEISSLIPGDIDDIMYQSGLPQRWRRFWKVARSWDIAFKETHEDTQIPQYHSTSIESLPTLPVGRQFAWVMASAGVFPGFSNIQLPDMHYYSESIHGLDAVMFCDVSIVDSEVRTYCIQRINDGEKWEIQDYKCSKMEVPFNANITHIPPYHLCVFNRETGEPYERLRDTEEGNSRYCVHRFEWDLSETSWNLDCDKPEWYIGSHNFLFYSVKNGDSSIMKCVKAGECSEPLWTCEIPERWKVRCYATNTEVIAILISNSNALLDDFDGVALLQEVKIEIKCIGTGWLLNTLVMPDDKPVIAYSSAFGPLKLTDTHAICAIQLSIYVWNLDKADHLYKLPLPNGFSVENPYKGISTINIIEDGSHVAASTSQGELIIWDIPQQKIQFYCQTKYREILTGMHDCDMGAGFWLWYQITAKEITCPHCDETTVNTFEFCPDCGQKLENQSPSVVEDLTTEKGRAGDGTKTGSAIEMRAKEAVYQTEIRDNKKQKLHSNEVLDESQIHAEGKEDEANGAKSLDAETRKNGELAMRKTEVVVHENEKQNPTVEMQSSELLNECQIHSEEDGFENEEHHRTFDLEWGRGVVWVELAPPDEGLFTDFIACLAAIMNNQNEDLQDNEQQARTVTI